jgi:hypothetical protein
LKYKMGNTWERMILSAFKTIMPARKLKIFNRTYATGTLITIGCVRR